MIGLGSIGKKHAAALRAVVPHAEISALRSTNTGGAVEGIRNVSSFADVKGRPEFVIISNPTAMHRETVLAASEWGSPLFIEKPLFHALEGSEVVAEKISQSGIRTYVACNLRFLSVLTFVKEWMAEHRPRINEVNIYCGSYLPEWRPGTDFRKSYSANESMGGGAHLDLIHEIDYCCWLFGFPQSSVSVRGRMSSLRIDAVDAASYHLRYPEFHANITVNYFRRDARRELEIVTEEETIRCDLRANTVTSVPSGAVLFRGSDTIADTYVRQLQYFIGRITDGTPMMNDFNEALRILRVALS